MVKLSSRFSSIETENNTLIEDLHKFLNSKKRVSLWKPKPKEKEVEKGIWNENYLKNLHNTLKLFRYKKFTQRKNPKIYKNLLSDSSVEFKMLDDSSEKTLESSLLMQKTIKGRSIQNMLQKGIKNFRDVIQEAKDEFSQHIDGQNLLALELKQIEDSIKNDQKLQEDLQAIESKDTKSLLSFLEKKLQRLQGEKRAHALFILAERERYYREASPFMKKHELDETFKNDAISLYLENVLMEGINNQTEEISREYVQRITRKIDQIASIDTKIENAPQNDSKSDVSFEITNEIKDQILPHVIDRINNEQLRTKQNILLGEIHKELFRDEFLSREHEEQQKICSEIIDEIIENVITEKFVPSRMERIRSAEAEMLASKIVEKILNEISQNADQCGFRGHHSYDDENDDGSNIPSSLTETETESSTDVLANEVVYNVLSDVLGSSSREFSDENETK